MSTQTKSEKNFSRSRKGRKGAKIYLLHYYIPKTNYHRPTKENDRHNFWKSQHGNISQKA